MNIVLIELEHRGHHISLYLKSIIYEMLLRGHSLTVITTIDAKKSGIFNFSKKKNLKFFYVDKIEYPKKNNLFFLLKFQINNFYAIKKIFKKIINISEIDHVYINTLDFFDKAISILGSPFGKIPFSGLYLNPKFYTRELFELKNNFLKNYFSKLLFFLLILNKKLINIFLIDPLHEAMMKNKHPFTRKKIIGVNEFSIFNDNSYPKKKIFSVKKKVILIFGSIKFNKGIYELLNFLEKYKKKNIRILIIGKQNRDINSFIKSLLNKHPHLKKNILTVNKYIKNDSSCVNYFRAADYIWIGYTNNFYGSSGVFFAACKMKKPVIVNSNGLVNWYNKKYKVGYSLNFNSHRSLSLLFNSIEKNTISKISNKRFEYVNKKHSINNFSKKIANKIFL